VAVPGLLGGEALARVMNGADDGALAARTLALARSDGGAAARLGAARLAEEAAEHKAGHAEGEGDHGDGASVELKAALHASDDTTEHEGAHAEGAAETGGHAALDAKHGLAGVDASDPRILVAADLGR